MRQHRSARTVVALLAAALLPLGSGAGAGAVASPEPSPARVDTGGSAGGGDAYFPADGNGGYDVAHYSIRDRYRFGSRLLTGTTVVSARATERLSRFHLDLLLGARSVLVNGVPARFGKPTPHELRVIPATPIESGKDFTVTVSYQGYPGRAGYLGERNFLANRNEVAAVNQPHMSPWWFAANDHPSDKARFDITVTVPRGKQLLANGRLVERRSTRTTTAFHWRARDPMATYQAFFVGGDFVLDNGYSHGLAYRNAVSTHLPKAEVWRSRKQLLRTTALVRWLQKQLGAYPFEIAGGVRTGLDLGFSLENQTRPVYSGPIGTRLLIHELAHQWLGDSVGLESWKDIWLNEGMASWMEWRYREARGFETAQARLLREWDHAATDLWTLPIADPGPGNLFDQAVYERGAMTVQALRHRLGEHDFWLVLKGWVALNRNGTATTEDLKSLVWQISGRDLTSFWDAWLLTPERPARTAANGLV